MHMHVHCTFSWLIWFHSSALLPISTTLNDNVNDPFRKHCWNKHPCSISCSFYPCHKANKAEALSFHPFWFVARAVTAARNCHSAARLLFSSPCCFWAALVFFDSPLWPLKVIWFPDPLIQVIVIPDHPKGMYGPLL